ncbi:hypothetical protein [Dyella sp. A6]|uniref:hypothetical protein n=1 Tax=Dyella aluminiiresistens TaxID=3069105 RepID=UPI002E779499|nr:hypothetical protein [Dyella sp. A6]
MQMKKYAGLSLLIGILALMLCTSVIAQDFPAPLSNAATKLAGNQQVPVFLPTIIPSIVARYGIKDVAVESAGSGYTVALYYSRHDSDATFAGMVAGSSAVFSSLPGTRKARLANGTMALFRPVSCGGSCAPANLWWQVDGFEYQLQLKLASGLDEGRQLRALREMANSMIRVRYPDHVSRRAH